MSAASEEQLGGPAHEARRLVEALGDWAETRLGPAEEHIATGSAPCQICPVCQLISALRGDRPEMLARLGEAWNAFLGVLTEHRHPPGEDDQGTTSDPEPRADSDDSAAAFRQVQNIEVR